MAWFGAWLQQRRLLHNAFKLDHANGKRSRIVARMCGNSIKCKAALPLPQRCRSTRLNRNVTLARWLNDTDRTELKSAALLFAALGDDSRLRLISRLCDGGPQSIIKLTRGSDISRQAISKHLRLMQRAGLVHGAKRGRESVWQLDKRRVAKARELLATISKRWDEALRQLRLFAEDAA